MLNTQETIYFAFLLDCHYRLRYQKVVCSQTRQLQARRVRLSGQLQTDGQRKEPVRVCAVTRTGCEVDGSVVQ